MSAKKNNKKSSPLSDYLFKPLQVDEGDESHIIVVFLVETSYREMLTDKMKPETQTYYKITFIDLTETVVLHSPSFDEVTVQDLTEFRKNVKILDSNETMEILDHSSNIILGWIQQQVQEMQMMSQGLATIKYAMGETTFDKGQIHIHNDTAKMAEVSVQSIMGENIDLTEEQVEKVAQVVGEVVQGHLTTDVGVEENTKKIKAELEYKLFESLPDNMKAGKISINMDAVLKEIKKLQSSEEEN